MQNRTDGQVFELLRTVLYTAVIGDILDRKSLCHQFLPQPIKPLIKAHRVVGRAMPVQIADFSGPQRRPFGLMTDALDTLRPGEVYVATGGSRNCATWGEIMTAAARMCGAAGAIVDGFHRDTARAIEQDWPVFSRGSFAQDAGVRSAVIAYRCQIEIEGVLIQPGDLIFGDMDGVQVIPSAVEQEVMQEALDKVTGESVFAKKSKKAPRARLSLTATGSYKRRQSIPGRCADFLTNQKAEQREMV
jgi:4-hydroxy-4-methyl-2-oxoglutarate aldolase